MCCLVSESIQGTVGTEETRHQRSSLYVCTFVAVLFLSKGRLSYSPRISQDDLV